ncbi:MAG TPA: CapA family protein [Candidatus Paceibacterota bacterium]|nr:CapA family protein [Candidatus Paceibacterota bacterium]
MQARKHHLYIGLLIVVISTVNVFIFSNALGKVIGRTGPITFSGGMLAATPTNPIINVATTTDEATTTEVVAPFKKSTNFAPMKLLHFGDAMFDRAVRKTVDNGTDLFSSLRAMDIMSDYDIRMLNLEGPIIAMPRSECQQKELNFQFPTSTAKLLKSEGFNAVTIANNHMLDCNQAGIDSSMKYLLNAEILAAGYPQIDSTWVESRNASGTRIAIVGLDATIGAMSLEKIPTLIAKLKGSHDLVLVTVHWGDEYAPRANDTQKILAHRWIDAGADVIIGNHPHVIENIEVYKGHAIFYAVGNFIFDQIGEKQNEGVGVGMSLYSGSSEFMLYPYKIVRAVPTFLSPVEANQWCTKYLGVMPNISPSGCAFSLSTVQ